MATTTNYSWTTPDDTALVKDGAAAIRSLGTAIDTTVFTNAGAAVAKATVDAKGDLIAGTADNTVARLAVGADGTTLVADSTEATGLKWGGGSTSYTPTLTSITIGNGTNVASYVRVGNIISIDGVITFGSTTSIAAGAKISLPVNAKRTKLISCTVHYEDVGTNNYIGYVYFDSASTARFYVVETGGAYSQFQSISGTIPFTFTTNDVIYYQFTYEVA
jgi:hypothetical protein